MGLYTYFFDVFVDSDLSISPSRVCRLRVICHSLKNLLCYYKVEVVFIFRNVFLCGLRLGCEARCPMCFRILNAVALVINGCYVIRDTENTSTALSNHLNLIIKLIFSSGLFENIVGLIAWVRLLF